MTIWFAMVYPQVEPEVYLVARHGANGLGAVRPWLPSFGQYALCEAPISGFGGLAYGSYHGNNGNMNPYGISWIHMNPFQARNLGRAGSAFPVSGCFRLGPFLCLVSEIWLGQDVFDFPQFGWSDQHSNQHGRWTSFLNHSLICQLEGALPLLDKFSFDVPDKWSLFPGSPRTFAKAFPFETFTILPLSVPKPCTECKLLCAGSWRPMWGWCWTLAILTYCFHHKVSVTQALDCTGLHWTALWHWLLVWILS